MSLFMGWKDCQRPHNVAWATGVHKHAPEWVWGLIASCGAGVMLGTGIMIVLVLDGSVVYGG